MIDTDEVLKQLDRYNAAITSLFAGPEFQQWALTKSELYRALRQPELTIRNLLSELKTSATKVQSLTGQLGEYKNTNAYLQKWQRLKQDEIEALKKKIIDIQQGQYPVTPVHIPTSVPVTAPPKQKSRKVVLTITPEGDIVVESQACDKGMAE